MSESVILYKKTKFADFRQGEYKHDASAYGTAIH